MSEATEATATRVQAWKTRARRLVREASDGPEISLSEDQSLRQWLSTLRSQFHSWLVLDIVWSKKRMFLKFLLMTMKTLCLIRTLLLVFSHRVPAGIVEHCGDRMLNLEITLRNMVYFVCMSFGSIILVFELLILVAEVQNEQSFITDVFVMSDRMKEYHISRREEKELLLWIRACRFISNILFTVAIFTMPSMIAYSAVIEISHAKTAYRATSVLLWGSATIFWIIRESKIYLILMSVVVLDLKMIQLRIKSMNRRFTVDRTLSVDRFVREFIVMRDLIKAHNKYIRWILMMIDYVSAPGNMANLYSAIASSSILIFKVMNISYSIFLLMATLCMIAIPGKISAEIMAIHPKLMEMQVHQRLTIRDKKRLLLLAESLTSHEGEIGFTNGLMQTFRNTTLAQYMLSLPTACMLFYSFVYN